MHLPSITRFKECQSCQGHACMVLQGSVHDIFIGTNARGIELRFQGNRGATSGPTLGARGNRWQDKTTSPSVIRLGSQSPPPCGLGVVGGLWLPT